MIDKIPQNIIDRISQLLSDKGLNGIAYGKILGLKKSPMTDWKNGKSKPTLNQIIVTSEYFNVSIDWLVHGDGEMHKIIADIQPEVSTNKKLAVDEKFLLETYKGLNDEAKNDTLKFVSSKPQKNSSVASSFISENGSEISPIIGEVAF